MVSLKELLQDKTATGNIRRCNTRHVQKLTSNSVLSCSFRALGTPGAVEGSRLSKPRGLRWICLATAHGLDRRKRGQAGAHGRQLGTAFLFSTGGAIARLCPLIWPYDARVLASVAAARANHAGSVGWEWTLDRQGRPLPGCWHRGLAGITPGGFVVSLGFMLEVRIGWHLLLPHTQHTNNDIDN